MNMQLLQLQHAFFSRVNTCNAFEVVNPDFRYIPVRQALPLLPNFARVCPVPLLWVDLVNVDETFKKLMLPVLPPFYHSLKKEIFMLPPSYFNTDADCKHTLLHETAHHIHFKEYGYNTSTSMVAPTGRMCKYPNQVAYNISEIVAETAATLAAQALGILSAENLQSRVEYVSMYRVGGGVPTTLPAEEGICIIPIAERLISLYGNTVS
jgi:hypothetical protein